MTRFEMSVKQILRNTKNLVKGYSDIQIKVRAATSNDPWGPSAAIMSEIADASHTHHNFLEIMEMVDKRLNDSGKNWRHVFKALILLDYLLQNGSEQVIAYTKENLYVVKTLKEFQYIDDEGRDQGINVRQKSQDLIAMLGNEAKLRENRSDRGRRTEANSNVHLPRTYSEEDALAKAIEESKRTAADEKFRRLNEDEQLQKAIEISEKEAIKRKTQQREEVKAQQEAQAQADLLDLFSDPAPIARPNNDAFLQQQRALYEQQQNIQNQLAAQQQVMAGLPNQGNPFTSQPVNNPFMGNQFGYQQQQQQQQQMMQQQQLYQQQMYQQQMAQQQQQQMMQQQQLYQQQMQNSQNTSGFGKVDLVKTGGTIDPFASLAASRVGQPGSNLVNLDANSLAGKNPATIAAEENAIKNPFASKMGGNNTGNRFQWDNKPNPAVNMSLAELAQGKAMNAQAGQNTMPGYQNGQNGSQNFGRGQF